MDAESADKSQLSRPNYCATCGLRLVQLETPHVARQCGDCGETVYGVEPGEEGAGIKIQAGDKLIIPSGWLTVSLDTKKSSGRLSRHGVVWFVHQLYSQGVPTTDLSSANVEDLFSTYVARIKSEVDNLLKNSEKLEYADLENPEHIPGVVQHLIDDRDSAEFWAFALGAHNEATISACESGNAKKAVLSAAAAGTCRAMMIFKQHLETHVWEGYATEAFRQKDAKPIPEVDAVLKLTNSLSEYDEVFLRTCLKDGREIAPRINAGALNEATAKTVLEIYLLDLEEAKKAKEKQRGERWTFWSEWLKPSVWTAIGAGITAAVGGLAKFLGWW